MLTAPSSSTGKHHLGAGGCDSADVQARSGPIPPLAVRSRRGTGVVVAFLLEEVARVPRVARVVFEVVAPIGLHQGALVVKLRGPLLILVVSQLIAKPDGQSGCRQSQVPAPLEAVLDDVVLGRALAVDEEPVR